MFVVTYLDTATGLYNAEPFFEEEGAQGSVEAHKQFEDRYKEIKIREMTKEQFDELESEDFYDEFVTKGTIPGIETSGEEEEEMSLKEAFEEMAKVDIAPVEDTEVFVDNDIVKEDEPTVDGTPSGPEEGTDTTIANLIIKAINGEWETIDEYNSLVSALHQANLEEFIPVIEDITNEEHKHIGQLQECLKKISPNTESIESGEEEGAKQLKENLEDMPKLKLNESMEDLDELVADKELCAHADIPLRIATDWIFRKNLQKQHEELFKDKEKKLAEFIKKQDNREPKLELKESLFEAADVRSMKRKAIKEALDKINSMKKSLKEGYGQSYYADGQDALQKVIETAKDMLDEDGIDEAVQYAIDNDLIYTDDIVALCVYYGVLDESEVINQMYELLYNDVYTAVSEYAEEQEDETQEESFRGIRHSKRGLKESYVEVDKIVDGSGEEYEVLGGGFSSTDALVPVEDKDGNRTRLLAGDMVEFYTWYDRKGNVIHEPVEDESLKESLRRKRKLKEARDDWHPGFTGRAFENPIPKAKQFIKSATTTDGFYEKIREILSVGDYEDYEIKELQRLADAKYFELNNKVGKDEPLSRRERIKFITKLTNGLVDMGFDREEANDIAIKRADSLDSRWRDRWGGDIDAQVRQELRNTEKPLTESKKTTDKFTAVYDELVSSKAGKTPFRKLKNKEEDRYDYNQVNYDDKGIIVRADSEEELDFAKEVAKAWNCETELKQDKSMKHPFGLVLKVDEKEKVSK